MLYLPPVGETYLLSVRHKQYQFDPSTRILTLTEEMNGTDFTSFTLTAEQ